MFVRVISLALCIAAPLHAHPGHGVQGGSHDVLHYLFEAPHLFAWAPLLGVGLGLYLRRRRSAND